MYAHVIPDEEPDLSFLAFGDADGGSERLYPAPASESESPNETAPGASGRGRFGNLEHETGLEPATPTLATWRSTN